MSDDSFTFHCYACGSIVTTDMDDAIRFLREHAPHATVMDASYDVATVKVLVSEITEFLGDK